MKRATRSAAAFMGFPLAYALSIVVGRATRLGGSEVALVWPAAAVAVTWALTVWRLDRRLKAIHLALLGALTFAANVATGAPTPLSAWFILVNIALAVVTVGILSYRRDDVVLRDPADLARLVGAVAAGSLCAAVLAASFLATTANAPGWETFGLFAARNGASALIGVSVWLRIGDIAWQRPRVTPRAALEAFAVVTAVAFIFVWIFWLTSGVPMAFLSLVPAMFLALRYSTTVSTVFLTAAGVCIIWATLSGRGPLIVADEQLCALLAQAMVFSLTVIVLALALYRDSRARLITELEQARDRADRDSELLGAVLDSIHDGVVLVDPSGQVVLRNARATDSGFVGDVVAAAHHQRVPGGDAAASSRPVPRDLVLAVEESRVLELTTAALPRQAQFSVIAFRDVTEERRNASQLREARDLFAGVLNAASEQAIIGTDPSGRITVFNHGAERLTGWSEQDMLGGDPMEFHDRGEVQQRADELGIPVGFPVFVHDVKPGAADIREWTWVRRDGGRVAVSVAASQMSDEHGQCAGYIGVATDITSRRRAEAELQYLALHDPLTGLANRALLMTEIEQALDAARGHDGARVGVVFLDLDGFKEINDTWGHAQGDEVLETVARRIETAIRPGDTAARLGGDEFAVVCPGVSDARQLNDIAERLRTQLHRPVRLVDGEIYDRLSVSVGVAMSDPSGTAEMLLRQADGRMYDAKRRGRDDLVSGD